MATISPFSSAYSNLQDLILDIQIHVLIHRHLVQCLRVVAQVDQLFRVLCREVWCNVVLELLQNDRLGLFSSESVAEWCLNDLLRQDGAVLQGHGQGVGDGSLLWVVVVLGELWVLHTLDLLAEGFDERRLSGLAAISVVVRGQATEHEHGGSHVLDAVITIGVVVHGLELLVDDANASLVCAVGDGFDVFGALAHLLELVVETLGGLDGGLRVEFGGVGDLEKDILHHVAAVWALELEFLAAEVDVVETPDWSGENGGDTTLTAEDLQAHVDSALAGITGGPRLTGHGVGSVTVGAEGLAVDPGLGDGSLGLLWVQTEHLGDDSGGGDLDVDDVVQTDLVEAVLQSQATLDFVCLDHALEHVVDGELLAIAHLYAVLVRPVCPICHSEDGSQVVGGVTPLSCEPAVVEVQPSDHGSNIEGAANWVEDVWCTGHAGAIGDGGALDDWAEQFCAGGEFESAEPAADGIEEDKAGSVDLHNLGQSNLMYAVYGSAYSQIRVNLVVVDVVCHVLDFWVKFGCLGWAAEI